MPEKRDERRVNGDTRGSKKQRRNVQDEKSLVNSASIGDEEVKHGGPLDSTGNQDSLS